MGKPLNKSKLAHSANTAIQSVGALLIALILGAVILLLTGANPLGAYGAILKGSVGSVSAFVNTLIQTTPLMFTGLSYLFAAKAGLVNLGMEGQMLFGAMGAAIAGAWDLGLPKFIHLPLAILVGVLAGGLYGLLAGLLKAKFGANEYIVTLMLNYVATLLMSYLANGPLRPETELNGATAPVLETALFTKLVKNRGLTAALFIAVTLSVLVHFFLDRTKPGFEIRAVGRGRLASETAGINIARTTMLTMFISGGLAAMAGVSMALGVNGRYIEGFSPGYGFNGIAVSSLASGNPLMVGVSALVFGALRAGAMVLNMTQRIRPEFADMIQALVVIFVAMPALFQVVKTRAKKPDTEPAKAADKKEAN